MFRLNIDSGIHRLKTLAPVHRSSNIWWFSCSSSYFLSYRLDCVMLSWCYGKRSYLTYFVLPWKFSNDGERCAQVSIFFFSLVNYRRSYSIHLKKSRFAKDVLAYPKNEVMAFPKIEIKWVWVSDIHVYIKADAAIWLWRYCHVRTCHQIKLWTANAWCKQTDG